MASRLLCPTLAALVAAAGATCASARERVRLLITPPAPPLAPPTRLIRLAERTDPTFRVDDPRGQLRTGFGGTMIDFYPDGDAGFHLSAGGRLSGRSRQLAPAGEAVALLPPVRGRGARRLAPTMLLGYDQPAGDGVSVGIDAGVVMGRIDADPGRFLRPPIARRDERGPNGVARMTMKMRF